MWVVSNLEQYSTSVSFPCLRLTAEAGTEADVDESSSSLTYLSRTPTPDPDVFRSIEWVEPALSEERDPLTLMPSEAQKEWFRKREGYGGCE